jgi:hypothetical protein
MADYQLPDIKNDGTKDELSIEIIDDTPLDDRNRAPMPEDIVKELEGDDLAEYSEKVQLRMKQLRKVWNDERRAKESAGRERDEALRVAQAAHGEVSKLKQRLNSGEKVYIAEATEASKAALESAREKLQAAYEAGDAKLIAIAQESLTDAKLRERDINNFKPSLQEPKDGVENNQQIQVAGTAPRASDPKAESWKSKNTWFGSDPEMTASALGLHEKLVKAGVNPASDDYYRQIDATMRKRFPEEFSEEVSGNSRESSSNKETPVRRSSTVVAPASRTTAPKQVKLTASAAAIAKRLGVTPEAYAREYLKLENNNG